jgi:hypothetical protein
MGTKVMGGSSDFIGGNFITNSRLGVFSGSTNENVGADLIANGTFSTDTANWTAVDCTIAAIDGGDAGKCLEITMTGGSLQYAKQALTVVAGHTYRVAVKRKSGTSGAGFGGLMVYEGATQIGVSYGNTTDSFADCECYFKPLTTSVDVWIVKNNATAGTMLFDTCICFEKTPAYIAADVQAMEDWTKYSGANLYRESVGANTLGGTFYSIKGSPTAAGRIYWNGGGLQADPNFVARFAGKTITIGCYLKTSTANHLALTINDGSDRDSAWIHPGDGTFWWAEMPYTFASDITYVKPFGIKVIQTSGDWYMTQPMGVFGKTIGIGNFQPIPGETIYFSAHQNAKTHAGAGVYSDLDFTDISVEVDSYLVIPKGVKRVYFRGSCMDSGSAAGASYMSFRKNGDSGNNVDATISCGGLANSLYAYSAPMWVTVDANGIYEYKIEATGAGTLTTGTMYYMGVMY